jgi:S-layer protein
MALITAEARNELTALFIGMFQAAPGATNLSSMVTAYEGGSTLAQIAAQLATKPEFASVYPGFLTGQEFADRVVANLLPASTPAGAKAWSTDWVLGKLNAGETRATIIAKAVVALNQTVNPNYNDAKALQANKVEVANHYSITLENGTGTTSLLDLQAVLSGVTAVATTVTTAIAAVDENHAATSGQTFTLTTGIDTVQGTAGNDTINGLIDSTIANFINQPASTFTALDSIDGGAGVDTLNIGAITDVNGLPTVSVSNVEIVNIRAAEDFTADVSGSTGLTAVNVTLGGDNVNLTAAATTAVSVSGVDDDIYVYGGSTVNVAATGDDAYVYIEGAAGAVTVTHANLEDEDIEVYGGTTVNVTALNVGGQDDTDIVIGSATASDQPSGAITVTTTGMDYDGDDFDLGYIEIYGGTTVTVNQTATSSSAAAATISNTSQEITQADVYVEGGASTTSVTLNQSAAVTAKNYVPAVAGIKQVDTVTFIAPRVWSGVAGSAVSGEC